MEKFYLTTTLPYVNSEPHIWHAMELIQADILARYFRKKLGNENVYLNTWTDEHGAKLYEKAKENWISPEELVDKYVKSFENFCEKFNISYDFFYRTSADYHVKHVYKIWNYCMQKGDIYKKEYTWKYCVDCEEFKTEKDLEDGKCPVHKKEPITISEENYFFAISKYKDKLLEYLDNNPEVLKPESKMNELKNFVRDLQDISISRKKEKMPWGIPVPNDEEQVIYVWFDALTNYLGTIWYADDKENFDQWRPWYQIFGPDNLRFQWAMWQGMLAWADLSFSKKLLCHWYVLDPNGEKMSKSLGNVIDPIQQLEKYWQEYVRYYLGAYMNTFGDWNYQEEELKNVINSNLADNFGNLLNRTINLANKKQVKINDFDNVDQDFKTEVDRLEKEAKRNMEDFEISSAYHIINKIGIYWNKYIDEKKPWEKDNSSEYIQNCLNNLSYLLHKLIDLYEPVLPESCNKARYALENNEKIVLFKKID